MSKFGITTETKSSNAIPLDPPIRMENGQYKFPTAKLVSVLSTEIEKKDETKVDVLQFVFKSGDNKKTHIHTEWTIEDDDGKYETKMEGLNSRIKHMYEAFGVFPEKGIGTKAKSFKGFFDAVAEAFNGDDSPIYKGKPVWVKLTYFNNRLGFPLLPNFIEALVKDKACNLKVNLTYDTIETVKAPAGGGGAMGLDDLPTGEDDFPDFGG